ncbi:hypothetical protein HY68_36980 [Streptomyces sp. AcH 505]|uniref:hypothetical protein n=1 Tax=Streptomyces sp. AcH 505 TaxID=352211 RepID=UPI000591AF30|nr:hypothetical protein HY68_36980 [Streptomyces sp. AcH 505]
MRRPALHHPGHLVDTSAWSHPYPTGLFSPVFYSSGAVEAPPVPAAVPTPAELAARLAPGTAAVTPPDPVVDPDEEKVTFTQRRLNTIMRDEKEEGRRAALRALAESAGLNPDEVDLDQVGKLIKEANESQRQRMSDVERREADAKAAADKAAQQVAAARQETLAAQRVARDAQQTIILTRLGVKAEDLVDVGAVLRNDMTGMDNPTEAQIQEYAEKLKTRRPTDFGGPTTAPQTLPPAPGGAPAGGPPQRTPASGKDAIKEAARARAIAMGLRTETA